MSFNMELRKKLKGFSELMNYADIETKGLWMDVWTMDDVHVLASVVEYEGEEHVLLFHDYPYLCNEKVFDKHDNQEYTIPQRVGTLKEGFKYWNMIGKSQHGKLSVHNCFGYDKPIIEKVTKGKIKIPFEKWVDTFVQSKVQMFDRPTPKGAKSPHGLKAFGIKMGINKPDITEWKIMDAYILHRVVEDVKIQKGTHKMLAKEAAAVKHHIGVDFTQSIEMESRYTIICQRQEVYGAPVDIDHIHACIEELDVIINDLETEIEPQLPMHFKKPSGALGRRDMAILMLGEEKGSKVPDLMQNVEDENGVITREVVKMYRTPTVKYLKEKKMNVYRGFNLSYGESPSFNKKSEFTAWRNENYPKTKASEWEVEKTEEVIELLNHHTVNHFGCEETDTHLFGGAFSKIKWHESKLTQHDIVKAVLVKSGIRHAEEWNIKKDKAGKMVKAKERTEVRYPVVAAPHNQMVEIVEKGEPLVTSPKFGDKEYDQLPEDSFGRKIAQYNTYMHRRRFISNPKDPEEKGILSGVYQDANGYHRIPAGVNNFSTATGRSSHRLWVNPPSDSALYGENIRRIITTKDPNKVLVSSDMNSAQLSIAAYYANNFEYFKAVCFGQEFKVDENGDMINHPDTGKPWYIGESGHCVNARAFTLISEEDYQKALDTQDYELIGQLGKKRKKSKGGTFATIFGASGKKVGLTLGIPAELGEEKKNAFLSNIGLDRPIEILDAMTSEYKRGKGGYIELPFGYFAFCKSPHARFNYLDQGTEGACQKWAEIWFMEEVDKRGYAGRMEKIISYHDEFTVECDVELQDECKKMMNDAYYKASIALHEWHKANSKWFVGKDCPDFNIELNAGAMVAKSYADIH